MQTKEVKYLDRDFDSIKNSLKEFISVYYPDTYKDFSDASAGMMMVDLFSYITDVLSFYQDVQFSETFLDSSTNINNVVAIAQSLYGYKPKLGSISFTDLEIYVLLPSTVKDGNDVPDLDYAPNIHTIIGANDAGVTFTNRENINFATVTEDDYYPYQLSDSGAVQLFLCKKTVQVNSGISRTYTSDITNPTSFLTIEIPDVNIISIDSIVDSNGNTWHEVPYLAIDTIPEENETEQNPDFFLFKNTVPSLLKYTRTDKKFISRIINGKYYIQFGSGVSNYSDEVLIPTQNKLKEYFNKELDYRNFLSTNTLGKVPSNTTLTINYTVSNGMNSNVNTGTLTNIISMDIQNDNEINLDQSLWSAVKSSVKINNPVPATGAVRAETIDEIKNNAMSHYNSQNRCVNKSDFESRILSMDPRFGSVAKVYADTIYSIVGPSVSIINDSTATSRMIDPANYTIGIYCLGYDSNKNLTTLNNAVKYNISKYIDEYKMLSDSIFVGDAFVINIGVEFEISVYNKIVNKKEVLLNCIQKLKDYFNIDNWQIGQPIVKSELYNLIIGTYGVKSLISLGIENKFSEIGETYSTVEYDISAFDSNDIIYPAKDPSIFEVRYPSQDIKGRIV